MQYLALEKSKLRSGRSIFGSAICVAALSSTFILASCVGNSNSQAGLPFKIEAHRLVEENEGRAVVGYRYTATPIKVHAFFAADSNYVPVYSISIGNVTTTGRPPKAQGIANYGGKAAVLAKNEKEVAAHVIYRRANAWKVKFNVTEVSTWDQGFSAKLTLKWGTHQREEPFDLTVNYRSEMATLTALPVMHPNGVRSFTPRNYSINGVLFIQKEKDLSTHLATVMHNQWKPVKAGQVLDGLMWNWYSKEEFKGSVPFSEETKGISSVGIQRVDPEHESGSFFDVK